MIVFINLTIIIFVCYLKYGLSNFDTIDGIYMMLDKPESTIDDPNNLVIKWSFTLEEIYQPQLLLQKCKLKCESNPEFLSFFQDLDPCEFKLAKYVLMYARTSKFANSVVISKLDESNSFLNQKLRIHANEVSSIFSKQTKDVEIESENQKFIASTVTTTTYNNNNRKNFNTNNDKIDIAIIVPVTSKGFILGSDNCKTIANLPLLQFLIPNMYETIAIEEQTESRIAIYIGFDSGDPVFDNEEHMNNILSAISLFIPNIIIKPIRLHGFTGKIVHIWSDLSSRAYTDGAQYFFLLGDDVVILTNNWISKIIKKLKNNYIMSNFGTVAFYDTQQPFFPTFPAFHRLHLDIFGKENAFDSFFTNTFADPWLSDSYVVFNSSFISNDVILENKIGGLYDKVSKPRYFPKHPNLENYIDLVQRARRQIAIWLSLNTINTNYNSYTWTLKELSYGDEGIYNVMYCKNVQGCIPPNKERLKQINNTLSRPLPFDQNF